MVQGLELGMFAEVQQRIFGGPPDRFKEVDFEALYADAGVNRKSLLSFLRNIDSNPKLAQVSDIYWHVQLHWPVRC